jgi:hypothetical protein
MLLADREAELGDSGNGSDAPYNLPLEKVLGFAHQKLQLRFFACKVNWLFPITLQHKRGFSMPESAGGSNIEVAHHLSEHKGERQSRAHEILEIAEAIVLAVVAIATAWSGYQAALWTGHQAESYGLASRYRVEAEGAANTANQERLYNASTVVEWLKAEASGNKKLADLFERRFLPEFRPAFESWKKTDPLNNPDALPGPFVMPEYRSARTEEAAKLGEQAAGAFERGDQARKHSDEYVRVTVTLATVLLLMAISQRFKVHAVRVSLAVVAVLLLCGPIYRILTLPRA